MSSGSIVMRFGVFGRMVEASVCVKVLWDDLFRRATLVVRTRSHIGGQGIVEKGLQRGVRSTDCVKKIPLDKL